MSNFNPLIQALERELDERRKKNPAYSIRAFARDLGLDQSALSRVLSGRRPLSRKIANKIAPLLNIKFEDAVKILKNPAGEKTSPQYWKQKQLALDSFLAVSDWYHDAILELTRTKNFRGDIRWIAKRLRLEPSTVRTAVNRLKRLGLLSETDNRWTDTKVDNSCLAAEESQACQKKYQMQIIEESAKAVTRVAVKDRSHSSMMLAINKSKVSEVRNLIDRFRYELSALVADKNLPLDSVYQLQVGFFPLTQDEEPAKEPTETEIENLRENDNEDSN